MDQTMTFLHIRQQWKHELWTITTDSMNNLLSLHWEIFEIVFQEQSEFTRLWQVNSRLHLLWIHGSWCGQTDYDYDSDTWTWCARTLQKGMTVRFRGSKTLRQSALTAFTCSVAVLVEQSRSKWSKACKNMTLCVRSYLSRQAGTWYVKDNWYLIFDICI